MRRRTRCWWGRGQRQGLLGITSALVVAPILNIQHPKIICTCTVLYHTVKIKIWIFCRCKTREYQKDLPISPFDLPIEAGFLGQEHKSSGTLAAISLHIIYIMFSSPYKTSKTSLASKARFLYITDQLPFFGDDNTMIYRKCQTLL